MSGQHSRSGSSQSSAPMVCEGPPRAPRRPGAAVWVVLALLSLLLVQLAVTAGICVHFTAEISRVKQQQKASQEWLCLSGHGRVQPGKENETEGVSGEKDGEVCGTVARSIRSLADKVVKDVIKQRLVKDIINNLPPDVLKPRGQVYMTQSPSAHLTIRSPAPHDPALFRFHQSCRHLLHWDVGSGFSHIHNMTMRHGKLQASQPGRYYIYSQTYFRYQQQQHSDEGPGSERQLVQCVHKKTSYASPTLLMKAVGTKCWAAEAEYGLNSLYQGGLFELKAGDEIFVTVSDPDVIDTNGDSSYFGSFRLDL
eukprot:gi/632936143/ref/XP_007892566.1/ PREDICTED: tumor necrosis factor ligand superfamily member 10-like [Callorhinchus milii]